MNIWLIYLHNVQDHMMQYDTDNVLYMQKDRIALIIHSLYNILYRGVHNPSINIAYPYISVFIGEVEYPHAKHSPRQLPW